ncbi:hydrogen peroxide-dependent heme synthase [Micropruina sonneratiae]|uniref:hydrogen peroxide-dependent heme synthase n=1 Tax=Micropruina sonneratiae TaxID=2986940 RepID=UPI002226F6DB|nr:hydrogen peroxide-dependent heme synthase [Micropruina sp. KQZ13P-5]MCW3159357.1 chlorite dismutase family protein [Micropruina sp. KQZ13P-5]
MSEEGPSGFAVWSVLRRDPLTAQGVGAASESLAEAVAAVEAEGVTVRGLYDVSAMRADADLMLWLHGDTAEGLQSAVRRLRRSTELAPLALTWSAMGVHRSAEFNKAHVPGFLRGERARQWLCVYPFVRSYDWYVLPDDERRAMLAEHGRKGAAFRSVIANTVSAFALNDYEWLLPMESDELTDLVDMMRELRATRARLHVREEVPFFTGRRIEADQVAEVLS